MLKEHEDDDILFKVYIKQNYQKRRLNWQQNFYNLL